MTRWLAILMSSRRGDPSIGGGTGDQGGGAAVRQTVPLSLDGMNLPLRTGNIDRGPGQYALVEVMEAACIDNRDKRYKKL